MRTLNFRRYDSRALLLLAALVTGGCASSSLATLPRQPVDLNGQWVLDPAASDDARRLISEATPAPVAPPPANAPADPYAFGTPQSDNSQNRRGGRGGSQNGASDRVLPPDDTGPRLRSSDRAQFVNLVALPTDYLTVEQNADRIVLIQSERQREFAPGATEPVSITDRYGSRKVHAGWSGTEFIVKEDDPRHASIEERLRRGASADTLELEVTLKAWNYKKIHVRSVYRRAGSGPVLLAPDGPPARGSH